MRLMAFMMRSPASSWLPEEERLPEDEDCRLDAGALLLWLVRSRIRRSSASLSNPSGAAYAAGGRPKARAARAQRVACFIHFINLKLSCFAHVIA